MNNKVKKIISQEFIEELDTQIFNNDTQTAIKDMDKFIVSQQKIIKLVYHEMECILKAEVQVSSLSNTVWNSKAYLFCEPRDLGTEFESLKDAMDYSKGNDERLAITHDGKYGCLRTEMSGDIYIAIKTHWQNYPPTGSSRRMK